MSRVPCVRRGGARRSCFLVLFATASLGAASLVAVSPAGPARVQAADNPPGKDEVGAALSKKVAAQFIETPLREVVQFLGDQTGVTIRLNRKSLEPQGVDLDTTFTLNLKNVPLRTVLGRLHHDFDIAWIVKPWGIDLISRDHLDRHLVTQIRDVSDLAPPEPNDDPWNDRLELVDELGEALKQSGEPSIGWVDDGGGGVIAIDRSGNLVVTTTVPVQQRLDDLLGAIREAVRQPGDKLRQAQKTVSLPGLTPGEQSLAKTLQEPTECDFVATPLREVVEYLTNRHKIPMLLDRRALEASGVDLDSPITETIRKVSLHDALKLILESLELTYVIRDELVLITTNEECERALLVRVYPASDFAPTNERDLARELLGELSDLVQQHTAMPYPSWTDNGGIGQIVTLPIAKALVISTTDEGHEQVAEFLAQLRRVQGDRPIPVPDDSRLITRAYALQQVLMQETKDLPKDKVTSLVMKLLDDVKWDMPPHFIEVTGNMVYIRQTAAAHRKISAIVYPLLRRPGAVCGSSVPVVGMTPIP